MTTYSTTFTLEDCQKLFNSKSVTNGEIYYKNPKTKHPIKASASTFKTLEKYCKQLQSKYTSHTIDNKPSSIMQVAKSKPNNTQELINQWLQNPLRNPKNGDTITVDMSNKSEYVKWYIDAYKILEANNYDKLPKYHLLFNSIDMLLYKMDPSNIDQNDKQFYEFIDTIITNVNVKTNTSIRYLQRSLSKNMYKNDLTVLYHISKLFGDIILDYISLVMNLIEENSKLDYTSMHKYVANIKENIKHLDFIIAFNNRYGTNIDVETVYKNIENDIILKDQKRHHEYNYNDDFRYHILNSDDIIVKVREYFEEILNIYNYVEEPDKSPFENIENKLFEEIEDPLITILKKVGIENINLATLELPKRPFQNDNEYNEYLKTYHSLKSKYEKDIEKWRATNMQSTPPKRPTMLLPTQKILNVTAEQFPRYIKDEEYNKTVKIYNQNEKSIKMYKELINIGILDLVNGNKTKSGSKSHNLLDKNKEYFENNVFNIDDNDKTKCNSNTDAISQEDFDDPKYLLSRLQLMYKLHKKNEKGDIIRTDCFYAPNFYNYIVSRIRNKETLVNPLTKEPISDEDIENLMKIMRIVLPNLEKPEYTLPIHDKMLKIQHTEIMYRNKPYYDVFISRKIGDIDFIIYKLCVIPADIDVAETGSTDIASTVFLFSIYKLFNTCRLMHTYMPPYHLYKEYLKLDTIHFVNYRRQAQWHKTRSEQITMFKHYLDELKGFL
jgi:hypothetical protein